MTFTKRHFTPRHTQWPADEPIPYTLSDLYDDTPAETTLLGQLQEAADQRRAERHDRVMAEWMASINERLHHPMVGVAAEICDDPMSSFDLKGAFEAARRRFPWCVACQDGTPHIIHSSLMGGGSHIHPG